MGLRSLGPRLLAICLAMTMAFFVSSKGQAMKVDAAPAAAPATPKQATVCVVGTLPGLLTTTNGSSCPVTRPMNSDDAYLVLWYTEKEIVRTMVTLTIGAATPGMC